MARVIPNRFDKKCYVCGKNVVTNEGYAVHDFLPSNNMLTWCTFHKECMPSKYANEIAALAAPKPINKITAEGDIYFGFNDYLLNAVKKIPGRSYNANKKCWSIPLVRESVIQAVEFCRENLFEIDNNIVSIYDKFQSIPAGEQSDNLYDLIDDSSIKNHSKLYKYQIEGAKFLMSHPRALLGDEMGVGKTIQAISAIPENSKVLIVAPSCVKFNWKKEIEKWRPEFEVEVISTKAGFDFPKKNGQIIVCNRELLPEIDFFEISIDKIKDLVVIIDEAHWFKNYKTKSTAKLSFMTKEASVVWALTGTPLLNRPLDLWGVLSACDMSHIVFDTPNKKFFHFFCNCFNARKGTYGMEWGMPSPIVPKLLKKVCLMRKRVDVLPELPVKTYTDLEVVVGDSFASSRIIEKLDEIGEKYKDEISNGALPPFSELASVRADIARSRIDAMLEYVVECEEQNIPLVVFSAHVQPIDVLSLRKGWGVIDGSVSPEKRQKVVEDFQAGKLKGVAGTIAASGVGVTLTRAWKCLFVDLDWVPANNWQAEDRICRIGQASNKVEIVRFHSNHPVDKRMMQILSYKTELISKTFE